jgi:hypothetical protein
MPTFSNERQAVDISQQIQEDISAYLVTITAMSAAVGPDSGHPLVKSACRKRANKRLMHRSTRLSLTHAGAAPQLWNLFKR